MYMSIQFAIFAEMEIVWLSTQKSLFRARSIERVSGIQNALLKAVRNPGIMCVEGEIICVEGETASGLCCACVPQALGSSSPNRPHVNVVLDVRDSLAI